MKLNFLKDDLLNFLFETDEARGKEIAEALEAVGIKTSRKFGLPALAERSDKFRDVAPADSGADQQDTQARALERTKVLLNLIAASLDEAVKRFDALDGKIVARLRLAQILKTGSALITTLLTSGVVTGLTSEEKPSWALALGVLALVASVLTVIVSRYEGGELNIAKNYAEVAGKHEAARALADRLQAYRGRPELFDDVDQRLAEAEGLVTFLRTTERKWGIAY